MSTKLAQVLNEPTLLSAGLAISQLYTQRHYRFRTFLEARDCAYKLSRLCPNPTRADIGLTEIFINAIEHGNLGIDYNEKAMFEDEQAWLNEVTRRLMQKENISKFVQVTLETTPELIRVTVCDQGLGFDWNDYNSVDMIHRLNRNGRGILIARMLGFDELNYFPPGNKVEGVIYRIRS